MRIPPVQSLLYLSRPTAIARLVVAIVIDAIQCHAIGTLAHIFNEGCERITPVFTDSNASSTVVLKLCGVWIETTILHALPRSIKRMPPESVCLKAQPRFVTFKATATARFALAKIITRNLYKGATITETEPTNFAARASILGQNNKPSKPSANEVNLELHRVTSGVMRAAVTAARPPSILVGVAV